MKNKLSLSFSILILSFVINSKVVLAQQMDAKTCIATQKNIDKLFYEHSNIDDKYTYTKKSFKPRIDALQGAFKKNHCEQSIAEYDDNVDNNNKAPFKQDRTQGKETQADPVQAAQKVTSKQVHEKFVSCLEGNEKETKVLYDTCSNECKTTVKENNIDEFYTCTIFSSDILANEGTLKATHDKCLSTELESIKPYIAKIIKGDDVDVSNSGFSFMEHCLEILKISNGKEITAKEIAEGVPYVGWFPLSKNYNKLVTVKEEAGRALSACVDQKPGSKYIENYKKAISYCGAMFSYVSHKDTTSGDQLEKSTKPGDISSMTSISNNNLLNIQGGDPAQQQMAMAMQQAGKQTMINCKFRGVVTRDYKQCALFAQTHMDDVLVN